MSFYEFTDFLFRKASKDLQVEYTTWTDGLAKCSSMLINAQRQLYKFLHVPIVVGSYFAAALGFRTNTAYEFKQFQEEQVRVAEEYEKKLAAVKAEKSAVEKSVAEKRLSCGRVDDAVERGCV